MTILDLIIYNMKKFRGKTVDEPLTSAEAMLCLVAYFKIQRGEI